MTEFDLGQVVGADGKGIVSIELISTSGKNKTYRITFTDESYFDYTVKDGDDAISAIVTSWEQTLSDSKVPSEKLTKDSLDSKSDVGHSHNGWTTLACGSYGTLVYNEDLRLAQFRYARSMNITTANTSIVIEANVVPDGYRPLNNFVMPTHRPEVTGTVSTDGGVYVRSTITGTFSVTITGVYHY